MKFLQIRSIFIWIFFCPTHVHFGAIVISDFVSRWCHLVHTGQRRWQFDYLKTSKNIPTEYLQLQIICGYILMTCFRKSIVSILELLIISRHFCISTDRWHWKQNAFREGSTEDKSYTILLQTAQNWTDGHTPNCSFLKHLIFYKKHKNGKFW